MFNLISESNIYIFLLTYFFKDGWLEKEKHTILLMIVRFFRVISTLSLLVHYFRAVMAVINNELLHYSVFVCQPPF